MLNGCPCLGTDATSLPTPAVTLYDTYYEYRNGASWQRYRRRQAKHERQAALHRSRVVGGGCVSKRTGPKQHSRTAEPPYLLESTFYGTSACYLYQELIQCIQQPHFTPTHFSRWRNFSSSTSLTLALPATPASACCRSPGRSVPNPLVERARMHARFPLCAVRRDGEGPPVVGRKGHPNRLASRCMVTEGQWVPHSNSSAAVQHSTYSSTSHSKYYTQAESSSLRVRECNWVSKRFR